MKSLSFQKLRVVAMWDTVLTPSPNFQVANYGSSPELTKPRQQRRETKTSN